MISKVVQDYVLMQSIGKGQYGNVYRAEHKRTKQLYAVKVMSAQKFKHTPKLGQFTNNEITILTKITHPNIIKFIEMLRTMNNYYLVYQFCNGGTLADHIRNQKRLTELEAIKIFLQLRAGFEVLFEEKILHRDLKPSNILFHNGVVKIADFGFCKEMMENDMAQTMVGSPIYMAPEILKGSVYDHRADIWSLGVILYEMMYGFCPYQENSITKLINLIDNNLLKFPPEISISNHVKILMKRMMTIKYRERISPKQLIKYPLEVKDKDMPVASTPKTPHQKIGLQTLREVEVFARRMMTYLAETLEAMSDKIEEEKYLYMSFLIFKILSAIQKDLQKDAAYWEIIKINNTDQKWDFILREEMADLEHYGNILRESLSQKVSPKMRTELDTNYIEFKYYLEVLAEINDNPNMKNRLINCFLINRHYMLAYQKKVIDFTDHIESKKSPEEKEMICKRYAFTRFE